MAQPLFWTGCEAGRREEGQGGTQHVHVPVSGVRIVETRPLLSFSFFLSVPLFVLICCPSASPWLMILILLLTNLIGFLKTCIHFKWTLVSRWCCLLKIHSSQVDHLPDQFLILLCSGAVLWLLSFPIVFPALCSSLSGDISYFAALVPVVVPVRGVRVSLRGSRVSVFA